MSEWCLQRLLQQLYICRTVQLPPAAPLFSYSSSAASPSYSTCTTSKWSGCFQTVNISVLLLGQPVFPQLQVSLTLGRFQAVRSGGDGRRDFSHAEEPAVLPLPYKWAQDRLITYPSEREGKGRRRFLWLCSWTRYQGSGLSSSLYLRLPGFYAVHTEPFHWFGRAVGSSASAPRSPSNAAPPLLSPCATLPTQIVTSLRENRFRAGAECQILFVRWDSQVFLWQVSCDSCSCHDVGVWEEGDGNELGRQGPWGALSPPPRKLHPKDFHNFISRQWSDSQKFASLHGHLPDRTWQHPSNKLLLPMIWVSACVHVLDTAMKISFRGISGCVLKPWNMMVKEISEIRVKPEMDANTIRMYGVPPASLINVCLQWNTINV